MKKTKLRVMDENECLKIVKNWDFRPYKEEAEVFKKPLSKSDKKLIAKLKF